MPLLLLLLLPLWRSNATRSSSFVVEIVVASWCSILLSLRRGFCDDVREMAEGLDDSHMESFWRYIKPLADFGGMCRMRGFPL